MIVMLADTFRWTIEDVGKLTLAQIGIVSKWMAKRQATQEKQQRKESIRSRARKGKLVRT